MFNLPSLFAVYINDLAQRINDLQGGIKIDDIFLSILLYADDIALIAPDELKLQQMLDVVTSCVLNGNCTLMLAKHKLFILEILQFNVVTLYLHAQIPTLGTSNLTSTSVSGLMNI